LACKHCRASAVAWRDPQELSYAEACRMMDAMVELGRPVLVFSGGEPLMRPDIFELMDEARQRGLPYALSTNGTLLTEAMADRVAGARPHRVSISLDGPDPETHDAFRQSPGAFDASIAGIRRLRARGVAVQVNTSVTIHNARLLPQIYSVVASETCCAWHLFMLVPVGCGLQIPEEQRLAAGHYERTLRWFVQAQAHASIEMKATCAPHVVRIARQLYPQGLPSGIRDEHGQRLAPDYVHPGGHPSVAGAGKPGSHPGASPQGHPGGRPGGHPSASAAKGCLAGKGICFVSRFGQVQGCGYLPVSAGSLRKQSLAEIWQGSEFFQKLRQPEHLEGKCGACEFASDCSGCRARAYAATGDPFAEEPHCAWVPQAARPKLEAGHAA
jgi:radical SAM protein with 4Fe4S-binding SPASM domain